MFKQVLIKMATDIRQKIIVDSNQVTSLDVLYKSSPGEGTAGVLVK